MKKYMPIVLGTMLAATTSHLAIAQQNSTQALPELLVAGDSIGGSARSANIERAAAPNAKVVIEGEQLNQFNDMSVGDAIRRLPGITFEGVNRSRSVRLRGIGKEYTQVLLDGRPILDGDSSRNMEIDRIPAILIERIEIIRSPLASMDSQGAAGTVNIITKRNFGPSGGGIAVGGGYLMNNGLEGEASGWKGGEAGRLRYFVGGGIQRRLLEETQTQWNYTGAGRTPNRYDYVPQKRQFDEYTALGRFEYNVDDVNFLTFSPTFLLAKELRNQTDYRSNTAMTFIDRTTEEIRHRERQTVGMYTEWKHLLGTNGDARLFLDYQKGKEDTRRDSIQTGYNSLGVITSGPTPSWRFAPIDLERFAPGYAVKYQAGAHLWETGAGAKITTRTENEFRSSGTPDASRNYKIKEDIYYAYISDSFSVFGRDQLTIGARVEHAVTDTADRGVGGLDVSKDRTDLNPTIQYKLSLTDDTDFRAGFAHTLRRPDLRDLTPANTGGNGSSIVNAIVRGNPNLVPEGIWGADVGLDRYLFDKLGILSVNVFGRWFKDKMESSTALEGPDWVTTIRNTGDGHLYGVELEARVPLIELGMRNLTLWSNATVLKSEVLDSVTGQHRRFIQQPDLITNIGLDYYVPSWKTTFGLNYNRTWAYAQDIKLASGSMEHTDFSALNRLDFSVKIATGPQSTLSFSALNLLQARDNRVIDTYSSVGVLQSEVRTKEPSQSTYYVRAAVNF